MNPVEVNGVTYRSVAQAWRELSPPGLGLVTVRWRLREGWNTEQAFMYSVIPPRNRRNFKDIRDGSAALREVQASSGQ